MEIFAGLSVAVLVLVALVVVIKTFVLWLRTRGLPELLLSLYLLCATVIGYPLAIAMSVIPASQNWLIHALAEVVMAFGWVSLLFFTLKVFRRDTSWARWLVGFSMVFIATGAVAYILEVTSAHPRTPQELCGFTVTFSVPVAIAYFWTTFEALGYHRQLMLRLRLGLADKAVVNRVLLWGLMALAAGSALVLNMAAMLAGSYLSPMVVSISSTLGLAHASCLFLAFHPPAWYTHWLEQNEPWVAG